MRDTTKPTTLTLEVLDAGPSEVTLVARTVIDRAEFGLDFRKQGATKMANALEVHARFTRT